MGRERFTCARKECNEKKIEAEFYPVVWFEHLETGQRVSSVVSLPVCRLCAIRLKDPKDILGADLEKLEAALQAKAVSVGKIGINHPDAKKMRQMGEEKPS